MISYADMLTLLLAVFIVMFAEATVDKSKLKQEADSLLEAFRGTPPALVPAPSTPRGLEQGLPKPVPTPMESKPPAPGPQPVAAPARQIIPEQDQKQLQAAILAMKELHKKLEQLLAPELNNHEIAITREPLSITIRLNATILFRNADATLTDGALKVLVPLGDVLSKLPTGYLVTVQGYTDSQPIRTAQYTSNWQLSTARAVSVVTLFESRNVPGAALSAEGFSKYRPLAANDTEAGRSQNRRVEIKITAPQPQQGSNGQGP
jgi:chemotaxis protein MotB